MLRRATVFGVVLGMLWLASSFSRHAESVAKQPPDVAAKPVNITNPPAEATKKPVAEGSKPAVPLKDEPAAPRALQPDDRGDAEGQIALVC